MKSDILKTREYVQKQLSELADIQLPSVHSVHVNDQNKVVWLNERREIINELRIENYVDFQTNELRKIFDDYFSDAQKSCDEDDDIKEWTKYIMIVAASPLILELQYILDLFDENIKRLPSLSSSLCQK